MPITPHDACREPAPDTVTCRFMEFWKFRDLFANEELHFTRTDLFKDDDPWEALPSDDYARKALGLRQFDPKDEIELNNGLGFIRQHSESYYISCWQIFEGETLHMWERYAKPTPRDPNDPTKGVETGVVVFTKFHRLKAQLEPMLDTILVGLVRYSEAETTGYNLIQFLFTKRACFEKEKELRILLQCYDPVAGWNRHYNAQNLPNREPLAENPLHPWVHSCKRRRVDLKSLVTEIRLSPWARPEEAQEARLWVKNKNSACPVNPSEIASLLTPTAEDMRKYGA
jgi:hypothetical protein